MSDLLEKCSVCGALIDDEDLFCANCGTEAPHHEERSGDEPHARTATHNFLCSGCGASMSFDASAGTLRCPFCSSEKLDHQKDTKVLAPSRVVPFKLNRSEAEQRMRQWLGRGFWQPGDLAKTAVVARMSAVYVPYWVFQARTHTYWTADTSQTPPGARGDWYPLSGEHHGTYSGLLVGASGALTPGETSAICPFHLAEGVPPEQVDLEAVTVEQFGVQRKYARPLACRGLENLEAAACDKKYVPGRSRNLKVNTRIEELSSEPMLLPVWMMAYRYNDRVFRFLVNGQTGQATGQKPVSLKKILAAVAVAVAVILLALLALTVCGGMGAMADSDAPTRKENCGVEQLCNASPMTTVQLTREIERGERDGLGCSCLLLEVRPLRDVPERILLDHARKVVLSELDEINRWLHKAQIENGGWGHRPANRPGGNGYGAINVITMQAKMAWALMQRCGLKVDAKRFAATHDFVARGTNTIGYVWYKDGGKGNPKYADMGRTGASAIAHYLSPVGGEAYRDFARLNAACIGTRPTTFPDTHGSPLLGMAWTGLGALPDPTMFRKLMDYNRWHFALSHCPDGTFYYQPNRDNNPQDFAADPRLCASAVTALILSAKHKHLQMTGAELITVD